MHWDGKLLPAIAGKDKVDRLAIVLTSENVEKLIAIPIIKDGTGAAVAQSVYEYLLKMNMQNSLEMICFDTTSANTGSHSGAATLLERKLERSLLWLPCRHHIAEILLRAVFEINVGKSSGPEVAIFERFAREWSTLNSKGFSTCMQDDQVLRVIPVQERETSKNFCLKYLAKVHIRHDYRELLQLAIIFLGGSIPNFTFRTPGATSHARFMSKAIYCLKIYMFHAHFKISANQLNGIRNICIFLVSLYIPYWFRTGNAVEAPNRDMQLIKGIITYYDKEISTVLLEKIRNHLWYLSEEAIALAFFDPHVDSETKKKMVLALQIESEEENHIGDDVNVFPSKKVCVSVDKLQLFISKDLSSFVTTKTKFFFSRLEISTDFLLLDPSNWPKSEAFCKGEQIAKCITVVNDAAERKIKLITDFNRSLTHNEADKQYLLHIVENYRKDFPTYTKSSLL